MIQNYIKAGLKVCKIVYKSHAFEVLSIAGAGWILNDGFHAAKEAAQSIKKYRAVHKQTKEMEARLKELKEEAAAKEDEKRKEIARKEKEDMEKIERVKKEIEEAKKNDPMKKEMERLIRQANRLTQED